MEISNVCYLTKKSGRFWVCQIVSCRFFVKIPCHKWPLRHLNQDFVWFCVVDLVCTHVRLIQLLGLSIYEALSIPNLGPLPTPSPEKCDKKNRNPFGDLFGSPLSWGGPSLTRLWTIHQVSKEAFQPGTWPTGFGEVFCEGMCQLTTFWRNVILKKMSPMKLAPLVFGRESSWGVPKQRSDKICWWQTAELYTDYVISYEISESRHEAIKISCFMSCQGFVAQFELPEKSTKRQLLHPSRRKKDENHLLVQQVWQIELFPLFNKEGESQSQMTVAQNYFPWRIHG